MRKKKIDPTHLLTPDEFMKNAEPCDLFQRVHEEMLKEAEKNPIDSYWVRVNQDWSVLGHQVMGAEVF